MSRPMLNIQFKCKNSVSYRKRAIVIQMLFRRVKEMGKQIHKKIDILRVMLTLNVEDS